MVRLVAGWRGTAGLFGGIEELHPGDLLSCGHCKSPGYRVVRHLVSGDVLRAADFEPVAGRPELFDVDVFRCPDCGTDYGHSVVVSEALNV